MTKFSTYLFIQALVIIAAACGAAPPPRELRDARTAYNQINSGYATENNPVQVHNARKALDRAENAFNDDPESYETLALAYVALRKAQLAEVNARTILAARTLADAKRTIERNTHDELRRTREQLAQQGQALNSEREARVAAEERAKEATNRLQESLARIATVKADNRGTVITISGNVLFRSGQSTLFPSAQEKLVEVANAIKDSDNTIVIEGHTDSRGGETHNQKLSEARAGSVLAYLVSRGVPAENIRAQGLGSTRPVASNSTADGRANNRRVEIVVGPNKEPT